MAAGVLRGVACEQLPLAGLCFVRVAVGQMLEAQHILMLSYKIKAHKDSLMLCWGHSACFNLELFHSF